MLQPNARILSQKGGVGVEFPRAFPQPLSNFATVSHPKKTASS
jgi:hypothetical protein